MAYADPSDINFGNNILSAIFTYLNLVTFGWFTNMFIIAIYIIIILGYYKAQRDFPAAMSIAGFVTFIVSLFLWLDGFILHITFGMVIAMMFVGVIVLLINRK